MRKLFLAVVAASTLSLSACADPRGTNALVGGGVGAVGGSIIGGIAGDPVTGALIGGGLGAVAGHALTPDYGPRYHANPRGYGPPVYREQRRSYQYDRPHRYRHDNPGFYAPRHDPRWGRPGYYQEYREYRRY